MLPLVEAEEGQHHMSARFAWTALLLVLLAATACGPTTPAAPVATAQAVATTGAAPATVGPSTAAQPTAQAAAQPAASGSQLRITLNQEPDTLNPFYSGLRATFTVTQAIFNG